MENKDCICDCGNCDEGYCELCKYECDDIIEFELEEEDEDT